MTTHPQDLNQAEQSNRDRSSRLSRHSAESTAAHSKSGSRVPRRPDCQRGPRPLTEWHCSQYTSWAFGKRLRAAGLLGSLGSIGDCFDNAMMESFWGTMQLELLDSRTWETREELANAIFEWIECWYNPKRRHSGIDMHSPVTFEALHIESDQDR